MNRDSRFDQLEEQILAGLRSAEGPEPSSDLDARIRARAHAAVAGVSRVPARRAQPRWMGLAAGVVVLVGTGLAIRVSQQVAREPSQVDAQARPENSVSPAASKLETAKQAPMADSTVGALSSAANAPVGMRAATSAAPVSEVPASPKAVAPPQTTTARGRAQPFSADDRAATRESGGYASAESAVAEPNSGQDEVRASTGASSNDVGATTELARETERPPMAAPELSPAKPTTAMAPPPAPPPAAEPEPLVLEEAADAMSAGAAAPRQATDFERQKSMPAQSAEAAGMRQQRVDPAATEPKKRDEGLASMSLETAIERVRAALARGDAAQALIEAKALREAYPDAQLPADVQKILGE